MTRYELLTSMPTYEWVPLAVYLLAVTAAAGGFIAWVLSDKEISSEQG